MINLSTPKKPLVDLIKDMQPEHALLVRKVYQDHREIIETIPGSSTKHQVWQGGFLSHVEETMNIAAVLYFALSACRPLDFSLSEVLLCAFLHDFDKVQRYHIVDGKLVKSGTYDAEYVTKTINLLRKEYGYILTDEQVNALKYTHGEGQDYHPTDRIMLPLATIVHCADIISARVWFDEGRDHENWL